MSGARPLESPQGSAVQGGAAPVRLDKTAMISCQKQKKKKERKEIIKHA